MDWPKNDTTLKQAGYKFSGVGKCRNVVCGAEIEWWETPNGKKIPLDPGTMEPHWSTCPGADEFRKKK
jgi:hypothetical protein